MQRMTWDEVVERLRGKRIAIVGSGPGCAENEPGVVDGHEVVIRVSNYRTGPGQGFRTDVLYSFFGSSIKVNRDQLMREGCWLCMNKLPNSKPIESEWHVRNGKHQGINYTYVYALREKWWPCPVFVPDDAQFMAKFDLLGKHQPTTGFAAILDVLECEPREVLLTGFDFFTSMTHNVNEPWRQKNTDDPICHRPDLELEWVRANRDRYPLTFDKRLSALLG